MTSSKDKTNHNAGQQNQQRVMLFDLSVGGHHPSYILYLIQYWCEHNLSGNLDIVISPDFMKRHFDVVESAQAYRDTSVQFIPISSREKAELLSHDSSLKAAKRSFQEWRLMCKYAKKLRSNHIFLMYFDTAIVPFIFSQKPPCVISGIYFRPTFHYRRFPEHISLLKDRFQTWREYFNLSQILGNPKLHTLFSLDPLAVESIRQFSKRDNVFPLADPVKLYAIPDMRVQQLKAELGIEPNTKKVFLLFGALSRRKGIHHLLEAIPLLPKAISSQICLLLVGSLGSNADDKSFLQERLARLAIKNALQVIIVDQFIPESNIQVYFKISDIILALYQRHVGMSGILNRAAIATKPVLSTNYGLMGELTRRYKLGLTLDSTQPQDIANSLSRCIQERPECWIDPKLMQQFANQNDVERFSKAVFEHISQSPPLSTK
ncbi:MAG: glycosyltransferase [Cyanobacteria bacterium P01_A01_bin.123]